LGTRARTIVEIPPGDFVVGATFEIEGDEFKHLKNSLRLNAGDQIEVYNLPSKQFALATSEIIGKNSIKVSLDSLLPIDSPDQNLVVFAGTPEPAVAEILVTKAAELGLSKLVFFAAERSQGNFIKSLKKKNPRLKAIAHSAFKQSRQSRILQVSISENLDKALEEHLQTSGFKLVFSTNESSKRLNLVEALHLSPQLEDKISSVTNALPAITISSKNQFEINSESAENYLVVGPEGGLSEKEESIAASRQFQSVTLGPGILRVETAFTVGAGLVQLTLNR